MGTSASTGRGVGTAGGVGVAAGLGAAEATIGVDFPIEEHEAATYINQQQTQQTITHKENKQTTQLKAKNSTAAPAVRSVKTGLGDATARINNQRRGDDSNNNNNNKKAPSQQQQQQQLNPYRPLTNVSQVPRVVVASSSSSSSSSIIRSVDENQVGGGGSAPTIPQRKPDLLVGRTSVSTMYRTHALIGREERANSVTSKQVVTLTELPPPTTAAAPPSKVNLTHTDLMPDEVLASITSSENIHNDGSPSSSNMGLGVSDCFGGVSSDALTDGFETISLNEQPPPITIDETHGLVDSKLSTPTSSSSSCDDGTIHPPPELHHAVQCHAVVPSVFTFPHRNPSSKPIPSHLILAEELESIRTHLKIREKDLAVHPNYMALQPELNYRMREILLDWLCGVSGRFKLKTEAYLLCTSLLDRFLSRRECSRDKFQLVGISCLILAAKYEEIIPPSIDAFIQVTDNSFLKGQILHMEGVILDTIGFEMTIPYVTSFTGPLLLLCPLPNQQQSNGHGVVSRDFDRELKNLATYYTLALQQHYQFLQHPTSLLGSTVVALAYYQLLEHIYPEASIANENGSFWDDELISASGYTFREMFDCMMDLSECLSSMSDRSSNTPAATSAAAPKYNSITKRYQKLAYDEVANRAIRLPRAVIEAMSQGNSVSCSQPLASDIGLTLLRSGCNAAEASIGIAAALGLLEPGSTGMGGDMFALYFDASKGGRVEGINGSGRSPKRIEQVDLTPQDKTSDGTGLHPSSIHCLTVPGAVRGWYDVFTRWGSGLKTLRDILQPVIELAREGVPIAPLSAEAWKRGEHKLKKMNATTESECGLLPVPQAGEIFKNPDLAYSMEYLVEHGPEGWYSPTGPIGSKILESIQQRGGVMEGSDLEDHRSTFPEPISINYKGVDIWEIPPNGQGLTALLALNILKALDEKAEKQKEESHGSSDASSASSSTASAASSTTASSSSSSTPPLEPLASLGHNSGPYLHRVIESLRLAFADTRYHVCDPDHRDTIGEDEGKKYAEKLEGLLSMDYARQRAERFDRTQTNLNHPYGSPIQSSSTVSFVCVDRWGNACSFINSTYVSFGSGIVPRGLGFSLQNRGANFTLVENHPNRLAGGKRPYHTIIPGLATKDGSLYAPFSVMGGFMQPQGHVQLLLNLIEFQMDPQAALDQARFCIESGETGGEVLLEDGIDEDAIRELKRCGHVMTRVEGYERIVFGRGQVIRRMENGVLWAGSDGRADGAAVGY